ncbi:MAG: hypothetical protein P4L11_14830 [Geothrix sp.]|nr:hypothetical protein [Geothrix sp.]
MAATFQTRIPALSDAELLQYLEHFQDYRSEAVEAALAELERRGLDPSGQERARIREALGQRDAATRAQLNRSFVTGLGGTLETRLARIRLITGGILAGGLGTALAIYVTAVPGGGNPLGFEPEDSKKYLHDVEVIGGKVNLLASQIRGAWNGLWQGRNLAFTVGGLTLLLALAFWFVATRRARDLAALEEDTIRG